MLNKWQTFLDELQGKITSMAFQTYFESTKFISEENGVVTFSVRNSLTKNTIEKKYGDKILEALKEAGFKCDEYKVIIDDKPKKTGIRQGIEVSTNNEPIKKAPISMTISKGSSFQVTGSKLNPRYTLDNYVVGSNNNVAVNAARAII